MTIDGIQANRGYERSFDEEMSVSAPDTNDEGTDPPDAAASLLVSGDINAQIAAMVMMQAKNQRDAHGQVELAENASLDRAEEAQIQALHDKADNAFLSSCVEGGFTVVSGGATMASTFTSECAIKDRYLGAGKGAEGDGKIYGAVFKKAADDCETDEKQYEHEAAHHKRNLDSARDAQHDDQKLLEHALEFYKQSQQGASDTNRISVGNR